MRHPDHAWERATSYLRGERRIVEELGWGSDGWVFSLEPFSVIKVLRDRRRFNNELRVYQ